MRYLKHAIVATLSAVMALTGASLAHADSTRVGGQLNKSGSLVRYDYTRTHTFTGPITLTIDDMTSTNLRLGLRDMKKAGGPQFTSSLEWRAKGTKSWNNILVGTRFAFQGRIEPCSWFCDYTWGGELTY